MANPRLLLLFCCQLVDIVVVVVLLLSLFPFLPSHPPISYWQELFEKFKIIHQEIQEKSHAINKSFGIFNEQTLKHCSTNIAHDIEVIKDLKSNLTF